jgi:hypothetical protein
LEIGPRLRILVEVDEDAAAIVIGGCVVRLDRQCLVEMPERLVVTCEQAQYAATIVARFAEGRTDRERPFVGRQRFRKQALRL